MQMNLGLNLNIIFIQIFFFTKLILAFEENYNFCIRKDPVLLDDIEKYGNNIQINQLCQVTATVLSTKEKESFHNTMCKSHGDTHKETYYYLKFRNGELSGHGGHNEVCNGKRKPYLAWIPYDMIQKNYAQELDPKENRLYIAKATDIEREKTELCHFRHDDLVTNISRNLFACIVMIFEDNFYGLESNINVLVEVEPFAYEIRNVTYSPWMNVTNSYKTRLGTAVLKNPSREAKQIFGHINYAYTEKIKLNTNLFDDDNSKKIPLLIEHRNNLVELDENRIGGINVQKKYYFGRLMDSKSSVNVEVIGQWAEHNQQFRGSVYEYFGSGLKRFHREFHGSTSLIAIDNAEPIFEIPESSLLTKETVQKPMAGKGHSGRNHRFERISLENDNNSTTADSADEFEVETLDEDAHGRQPYPNFYPWSLLCGLIIGCVLIAVVYGMVRSWDKGGDNSNKNHKYRVAENC